MKMTKIESARIIEKQKGYCRTVHCKDCFITEKCYKVDEKTSDVLQRFMSAEAYIKRHEGKSVKKVKVDTVKSNLKGDEHIVPNPDPTPLEIAKIIRDNEYVCLYVWDCTRQCPISNSKTGQLDCSINRKQLIDSYISSHEKPRIKSPIQCYKCVNVPTCKRKEKELSILHFCDGYVSNESMMYIHTVDPNEKVKPVYVTCINNRNTHTPLTIGKKYEVVGEGKGHYTIQDDIGTLCCMQKDRFDDGKEKASEPVGNTDKLVEPVIEPIKFDDPVPEYVYTVTDFGIFQFYVLRFEREWVKRKDNTESLIEKVYAHEGKKESERVRKEVSIDIKDCYSFKDAVAVAKKNWGLE